MVLDDKQVLIEIDDQLFHCAMDITMHYIGGKWKTVVLWYLKSKNRRFSELKMLIPQMTEKMLSLQLKQLEKDGFVAREVISEKSPKNIEYSLTEYGKTLIPILDAISSWGREQTKTKGKTIEIT